MTVTSRLPVVQNQFGQLAKTSMDEAAMVMGNTWGPIPAYLIEELGDEELAQEIKRRWLARRIEQGPRNLLDMRMLAFLSPEKVQDQWQSVWTGKPMKKLRHSTDAGMSIGVYNQLDPIIQSLIGVLAGNEPSAFEVNAKPRDMNSEVAAMAAEVNEEFLYFWRQNENYDRVFMDGVGNMVEIGRNWQSFITDSKTRRTKPENHWPGHVAGYWQSDMRTLEQVIVARYLTLGEAMRMYPDKAEALVMALRPAATRTFGANPLTDEGGWMRYATACLLTLWYRTEEQGKIGMAVTLLSAAAPNTPVDQMILEKNGDTGYTDIPLTCTPLFKVANKAPDESQGLIFKMAGVQTEFNEIVSATHDMLYRDFYPTWFAKGFTYRSGPRRIGRSAMLALPRADQAIGRIQDTMNAQGAEHFAVRLEEQMYLLGITNRMFLGTAPTSNLTGDAIDANINSLMARVSPIRKNIKTDGLWGQYQVIDQQIAFGEYTAPDGTKSRPADILDRAHELEWVWTDTFQSVKKQQLALSGLGKVHGLDHAQRQFGIARRASERRRMAKERTDEVMFPQFVSQTAAAIIQKVNASRELSIAATLAAGQPLPKAPVTRVTLSGLMSPGEVQSAAKLAGIEGEPPTPADMAGTTRALPIPANSAEAPAVRSAMAPQGPAAGAAAAIAARAAAATSAAAAPSVPKFEADNAPGAPAMAGDQANPTNANPATGSRPG